MLDLRNPLCTVRISPAVTTAPSRNPCLLPHVGDAVKVEFEGGLKTSPGRHGMPWSNLSTQNCSVTHSLVSLLR